MSVAVGLPHFPRRSTAAPQTFQLLFVFKCVHAGPEAVVAISDELVLVHEPLERFTHQLFFVANVVKDFFLENEVPAVDAHRTVVDRVDS